MTKPPSPAPNEAPPGATPFKQQETVDKPGIIGARWWQESMATQIPRRQAMTALLALGGVMATAAVVGSCVAVVGGSSEPDVRFEPRASLDMQKEYGWDFGARGDALVFDGASTQPFDRGLLARMEVDLAPAQARLRPFFVPTLFQSVAARPKTILPEETTPAFVPLQDALKPISTVAMTTAYEHGVALAKWLSSDPAHAKDLAVIVDLPGPEAVAFAAGAAGSVDPVFLFDNWPHPRGDVAAHQTLAAVAYYQPLFARVRSARNADAPALFVLDRNRLVPYVDDVTQFDNRHLGRVPSAAALSGLGVKRVLTFGMPAKEQDDLVDDFLGYADAKLALFMATPADATYGNLDKLPPYVPTPRATPYSSGQPAQKTPSRPRPAGFGTVPVAIAIATGGIIGAKMARSGSWNRSSGSSGWSSGGG
jgi:hypothetical protein